MDQKSYEQVDPLVDEIAEQISDLLETDAFRSIKQKLAAISSVFGEFSVNLEMNVRLFDPEGLHLPLLQTGLSTTDGAEPWQMWGDSTPQRYVVFGDIVVVPNDHCPQCWAEWGFKEQNPKCPGCGLHLGAEVKLLLDSDCCPHCEKGKVSAASPMCSECNYCVNLDHVVWG